MAAHRIISSICLVALTLSSPTAAAPAAATATESTAQAPEAALESIDRTLREIVELLRVQLGNQRAELAVQRLDIASRELVARERELYAAETQRDGYERNHEQMKFSIKEYGDLNLEESGMTEAQLERSLQQMKANAEEYKRRLWRADQRLIDLRKEITRVREDLLAWEQIVAASFVDEE